MRYKFLNKNSIANQKKIYISLLIFALIGIISGILFYFILNDTDKTNAKDLIEKFFISIKENKDLNYTASLINSLINNITLCLTIWLLGISIIGMPIIILSFFTKCFVMGFSISSIIARFGMKGILKALLYIFPHQVIGIIMLLLLCFYSVSFCIKLFNYLFLKKQINFKEAMNRYFKILLISIGVNILLSLYEVYIATYFMRLIG